jgi:hypothetical protein
MGVMGVNTTRHILLTFNMFISTFRMFIHIPFYKIASTLLDNNVTVPYNEAQKTENKNSCEEKIGLLRERNNFWLQNCETQHKLNFLLFMREKKTKTRLGCESAIRQIFGPSFTNNIYTIKSF